ncbi:MAG: hypothetical protein FWH03_02645 [Firmicutes bacterium]|nr:hypothetical protein [Bacillota bacterium]
MNTKKKTIALLPLLAVLTLFAVCAAFFPRSTKEASANTTTTILNEQRARVLHYSTGSSTFLYSQNLTATINQARVSDAESVLLTVSFSQNELSQSGTRYIRGHTIAILYRNNNRVAAMEVCRISINGIGNYVTDSSGWDCPYDCEFCSLPIQNRGVSSGSVTFPPITQNGIYELKIEAHYHRDGNTGYREYSSSRFTIDRVTPEILMPLGAPFLNGGPPNPSYGFRVNYGVSGATLYYKYNATGYINCTILNYDSWLEMPAIMNDAPMLNFSIQGKYWINERFPAGNGFQNPHSDFWTEGFYSFMVVSNAGRISSHSNFSIDGTPPVISSIIPNDGFTNSAFTVWASDSISGVASFQFSKNGGTWTNINGTSRTINVSDGEGVYQFRATDRAGNTSPIYSITLDLTLPTGSITNAAGTALGAYTNAAFRANFSDALSGMDYCQIMRPNTTAWQSYTAGTLIAADSGDGHYQFRGYDRAGNVRSVSITLVFNPPIVALSTDAAVTNAAFTFTAESDYFARMYYSLNSTDDFTTLPQRSFEVWRNTANNGVWRFYAEDLAGNVSELKTIVLDTIAPAHNTLPQYTNQNIIFAPTDAFGIAAVYYRFGRTGSFTVFTAEAFTIAASEENNGEHWFYAADVAGNLSEPQRVVLRVIDTFGNLAEIQNAYKVTSWYTATLPGRIFNTTTRNVAGVYSFADYETALRFAIAMEFEFRVQSITGGFLYVTASNESIAQIYASRALLDPIVELYAKGYLSGEQRFVNGHNNYQTPVNADLVADPTALTRQTHTLPAFLSAYAALPLYICPHEFRFRELSGGIPQSVELLLLASDTQTLTFLPLSVPFDTRLLNFLQSTDAARQGYFLVSESDAAGNIEQYIIYLDLTPPELNAVATLGSGAQQSLTFDAAYINTFAGTLYYTGLELTGFFDNDEFSMLRISGRGINTVFFAHEQLPHLHFDADYYGRYRIELYDRSLNTLLFDVWIAGEPPRLSTTSLAADAPEARFTIFVPDTFNAITALEFYKIDHNGIYERLHFDDAGNAVSAARLTYTVTSGGKYVFIIEDLFGRRIETRPVFYLKGLPVGMLLGVTDGGVTNRDVSLSFSPANTLIVYTVNGATRHIFNDYSVSMLNNTLTAVISASEETSFHFVFFLFKTDEPSLFVEYTFEIDCIISDIWIFNNEGGTVAENSATTKPFFITWTEAGTTLRYHTSATPGGALAAVRYTPGTVLYDDAVYFFSQRDYVGNVKEFSVQLETHIAYRITGNHNVLSDGAIIANNPLTVTLLKPLSAFSVANADGFTIQNGGTLFLDGTYQLSATDYFGNTLTLRVIIHTAPPEIRLDGVSAGGVTNGSVTVRFENHVTAHLTDNAGRVIREVNSGAEFSEHGDYRIRAEDFAGNQSFAAFSIKKQVNFLASVPSGALVGEEVSIEFFDELHTHEVTLNGAPLTPNLRYAAAGHYEIFAEDAVGNALHFNFTIIPPRSQSFTLDVPSGFSVHSVILDGANLGIFGEAQQLVLEAEGLYALTFVNAANGAAFSLEVTIDDTPPTVSIAQDGGVVVISDPSKQNIQVLLERNGQAVAYTMGERLSDVGTYRLTITDDVGNVNTYEFEIIYRLNTAAIVLIVLACVIGAAVLILIIRARLKPKIK